MKIFFSIFLSVTLCTPAVYAVNTKLILRPPTLKEALSMEPVHKKNDSPYFDLPITYNSKVKTWINYYQNQGRQGFKLWLQRSNKYIPKIVPTLEAKGLPKDLVYLAMIESGFSPHAVSSAEAVGYWQFIKPTATRYGLKVNWWLDERRDIVKSTLAAASYLNDLHHMFNSWYLAAAAYNMGEGRVKKLIKKYNTRNYWTLSKQKDFPRETAEYIPKLLAAMLIAKTPNLYGFKNLVPEHPVQFTFIDVPGGTDLENLAYYVGSQKRTILRLNPELTKGFVPQYIKKHRIRIPQGYLAKTNDFILGKPLEQKPL